MTSGEGGAGSTPTGHAGTAQGGASPDHEFGGQPPVLNGGTGPIIYGGSGGTSGSSDGGALAIAGSGGVGGGKHSLPPVCDSPQTTASQLVSCANGIQHRPKAALCALPANSDSSSDGGAGGEAGAGGSSGEVFAPFGSTVTCTSARDCSDFHLGSCRYLFGPGPMQCASGCQTDSECGGGVCVCNESGSRCLPSTCKIDADCGTGYFCALKMGICDEGSFACLRKDDECWSNNECTAGSRCTESFGTDGLRMCSNAVCGRPFLVEETARLADAVSRQDWLELELSPDLAGLSALERAELAAHFSQLGRMEHASIAAFARFNLQLLALGAPVDLVEGCNRALVDETRHARLCFALASHYAGVPIGPGKLDIDRSCDSVALCDVARLVISEGCIGETVAALDAMEQATIASDPIVSAVLTGIARDERNHAELAYRFLRWALTQATAEERRVLREEAELRLAAFEATANSTQRLAAREVARPMLLALFASHELSA